tara:strand:- start:5401 stop:6768 length:1368 start_codon:yes stop_codon:yes gene_type:complete
MLKKEIKKHIPEKIFELDDVWVVGGAIREAISDKKNVITEIDIASRLKNKEKLEKIFRKKYGNFYKINKKLKTIRFQNNEINIDITYFDQSIKDDLLRRDFKMNAIAWNNKKGFYDPLNGLNDIKNKKISSCTPGSIKDDPIRILRSLRFATKNNFSLSVSLQNEIKKYKYLLKKCAGERIHNEIKKGFELNPYRFADLIIKTNILETIFEEWQYTKNCKANQDSKMTVQEHSLKTLKKFQEVVLDLDSYYPKWSRHIKNEKKCEWWFYFSVLFHDIGKPKTAITQEQKITYPKHAQIGFSLIEKNLQELRFSNEEKKGIEQTISGHLRVSQISNNNQNPTKKAMNRFFKTFKENSIFMILLDFSDANAYPEKIKKQILTKEHLKIHDILFDAFFLKKNEILPEPLLNGSDLIGIGYPEGPLIGQTLNKIKHLQINDEITNQKDALEYATKELNA